MEAVKGRSRKTVYSNWTAVTKRKFSENIKKTSIHGLLVINRPTFKDKRGFFREVFRLRDIEEVTGIFFRGRQWNHSRSKPGVIRGLHAGGFNKLVYPVTGKIFGAIVDIRKNSKTFAKVETVHFDGKNHKALFIPKGLANSFCVYGKAEGDYMYLVDAYHGETKDLAIAWDDPDLGINWPVKNPIISESDKNNPTLRELFPDKFTPPQPGAGLKKR